MNVYDNGDLIRCTGTFTDSDGTAHDPTGVYFKFMNAAGSTTSYVYGVNTQLVKSATGIYYVDVNANAAGIWKYRYYSTGSGQAAGEGSFKVKGSEF